MPIDLQTFKGDNCDNIITQGDVVLEQRYVRTTIIEEKLDEQLLNWTKSDGSVLANPVKAIIGLPIWYISPDEGHMIAAPQKVSRRSQSDLEIGTDGVVLPGLKNRGASREIIKIYHEDIEKKDKLTIAVLDRLSDDQRKSLSRSGEVTLAQKEGRPLTIRLASRSMHRRQNQQALKVDFKPKSRSNLAFSSHPGFVFRNLIDTTFDGDCGCGHSGLHCRSKIR